MIPSSKKKELSFVNLYIGKSICKVNADSVDKSAIYK